MTWQTHDGVRLCQNLAFTNGVECVWADLNLRIQAAGWVLVDSDDSLGNPVTGDGAGVGGLNNIDAWVLVRDPGGRREELYIHRLGGYSWRMQYSSSVGFPVAAHPAAPGVAADEVSLCRGFGANWAPGNAAQRVDQWMFPNPFPANVICHCAAQDVPDGDVYAHWMFIKDTAGILETMLYCDCVDEASTPSTDQDKALFYYTDDTPLYNLLCVKTKGTDQFYGYMNKGMGGEEWSSFSIRFYTHLWAAVEPSGVAFVSPNPHDVVPTYTCVPTFIFRDNTIGLLSPGDKGMLHYARWNPNRAVHLYGDLLTVANKPTYVVCSDLLLPGWYSDIVVPVGGGSIRAGRVTPAPRDKTWRNVVFDTVLGGGSWQRWLNIGDYPDSDGSLAYAAETGGNPVNWLADSYAYEQMTNP